MRIYRSICVVTLLSSGPLTPMTRSKCRGDVAVDQGLLLFLIVYVYAAVMCRVDAALEQHTLLLACVNSSDEVAIAAILAHPDDSGAQIKYCERNCM